MERLKANFSAGRESWLFWFAELFEGFYAPFVGKQEGMLKYGH